MSDSSSREALLRLTMCAREECDMCKYKDECDYEFQYKISTDNMNTLSDALLRSKCEVDAKSAEAVHKPDYSYEADMVRRLKKELSADAEPKRVLQGYCKGANCKWWNPQVEGCNRCVFVEDEYTHPSADAVQGWIPIKDGLPKAYKDVMATVWFEDDGDDDDAFEIAFGSLNKFGKWDLRLADGSECIKGFYVQAWQPLPTPYKGGDDE